MAGGCKTQAVSWLVDGKGFHKRVGGNISLVLKGSSISNER